LLAVSCGKKESADFVFRYSNEQPKDALRSKSMIFFKRQLEECSNDRIKVELFFGGVLGNERELMDFVQTGVLQGTRGGFFADANPKYILFTLPFLVDDWDQAQRLVQSEFTREINEGARKRGFHVPATGISQGFRAHTNSKRPIRHPDDLKGLKMRVPSQEVYVQTSKAFGANPQELPYAEVYQALQTGVVDGQDNAPSNIWDFKIHEVSEYLTITNYSTGPDPLMVNLGWYESLPYDLKVIFDEVSRETMEFSDQINREKEAEYIQKISNKLEVNHVTGDDLIPFRDAVKPVNQYFEEKGILTLDEIEKAREVATGKSIKP
jgi:C4-dicarboxylate-binding protein DctP